jgi:hypothetical protein
MLLSYHAAHETESHSVTSEQKQIASSFREKVEDMIIYLTHLGNETLLRLKEKIVEDSEINNIINLFIDHVLSSPPSGGKKQNKRKSKTAKKQNKRKSKTAKKKR